MAGSTPVGPAYLPPPGRRTGDGTGGTREDGDVTSSPAALVLLDLDGTLTDSFPGISASVTHAFTAAGLAVPTPTELRSFVGPPLPESFLAHGVPQARVAELVTSYRAVFAAGGMYDNAVYDGVLDALAELRRLGCALVVATSKPEIYAVPICERLGITPYVDGIFGAPLDHVPSSKALVIERALTGRDPGERRLMVGDREHDVLGAAAHGVPCLGVRWGYAAPDELEEAGAVRVVDRTDQLAPAVVDLLGL